MVGNATFDTAHAPDNVISAEFNGIIQLSQLFFLRKTAKSFSLTAIDIHFKNVLTRPSSQVDVEILKNGAGSGKFAIYAVPVITDPNRTEFDPPLQFEIDDIIGLTPTLIGVSEPGQDMVCDIHINWENF